MWTSRTLLACRASKTGWGTSVPCSSAGSLARIRATSTATLPTPMTATDSASRVNAPESTSGMTAVPVHEVGGRVAARQVLARNAEPPIPHRPGRVDHRVVRRHQVVTGHVLAEVHPAGETDAGALQHLAQVLRDRLDRLVVGSDPVADQAIRGGETVDHVHAHRHGHRQRRRLLDQRLGGIKPGRAGADHGNVEHKCLRYSTGLAFPSRRPSGRLRLTSPGDRSATASVICLARCCGVRPASSSTSSRLPWGRNSAAGRTS